MTEIRGFKGVWIPREVWLNKELSCQDKCFIAEIHSLDNEEGCFASNAYFAEFFGLSKSRVSAIISKLVDLGIVINNITYKENSKEIERRILKINFSWFFKTSDSMNENNSGGIRESEQGGIRESEQGGIRENSDDIEEKDYKKENTNSDRISTARSIKLFKIAEEPKKVKKAQNIITMRKMAETFSENELVVKELLAYLSIRLKKGLEPIQWQAILNNLKAYSLNADMQLQEITSSIAGGYMQIVPDWKLNKNQKQFDNTSNHPTQPAFKNLSKEEQYHRLARNADGTLKVY